MNSQMMKTFLPIAVVAVVPVLAALGTAKELHYKILTTWNNATIDHLDEPAQVRFSAEGDFMRVQACGKFYNSPKLPNYIEDTSCPGRSVLGLWNYEVLYL